MSVPSASVPTASVASPFHPAADEILAGLTGSIAGVSSRETSKQSFEQVFMQWGSPISETARTSKHPSLRRRTDSKESFDVHRLQQTIPSKELTYLDESPRGGSQHFGYRKDARAATASVEVESREESEAEEVKKSDDEPEAENSDGSHFTPHFMLGRQFENNAAASTDETNAAPAPVTKAENAESSQGGPGGQPHLSGQDPLALASNAPNTGESSSTVEAGAANDAALAESVQTTVAPSQSLASEQAATLASGAKQAFESLQLEKGEGQLLSKAANFLGANSFPQAASIALHAGRQSGLGGGFTHSRHKQDLPQTESAEPIKSAKATGITAVAGQETSIGAVAILQGPNSAQATGSSLATKAAESPAAQAQKALSAVLAGDDFRSAQVSESEVVVEMEPRHLGSLKLTVSKDAERVSAHMVVANEAAAQAIRQDITQLLETARGQGVNIDSFTVSTQDRPREEKEPSLLSEQTRSPLRKTPAVRPTLQSSEVGRMLDVRL